MMNLTAALLARRGHALLLGGGSSGRVTGLAVAQSLAAGRAAVALAGRRLDLLSLVSLSLDSEKVLLLLLGFLTLTCVDVKLHSSEVEDSQVVQLFSKLMDTSKHVHLGAINHSRVTTSSNRSNILLIR